LKKEAKTFWSLSRDVSAARAKILKSFLVLFFKKELLPALSLIFC